MKLNTIKLFNFRSSTDLVLSTEAPRVLVAGQNGTGKSSIRDAVQWALRGICAGTDAKGSGWEALVPDGSDNLRVALVVDGLGAVHRAHMNGTRELLVEGVKGESGLHQQALYAKLNTAPAFLEAVLDTGKFLSLHHAEAKALVLALLDVHVQVDQESLTLDQLDARYKIAFQSRTTAKATAKSLSVPPTPEGEALPKVEDIEAQLTVRREELRTLTGSAGVTAGKRQVLERQLADALKPVPISKDPSDDIEAILQQIAAIEESARELTVTAAGFSLDWSGALEAVAPFTDPIGELKTRIHNLRTATPKEGCVLDRDLPCPVAKIKFTNLAKVRQAELDAIPPAAPEPGVAQKAIPVAQDALREAQAKLAHLRSLQAEYERAKALAVQRANEVDAIRAELSSLPDTTEATGQIQTLQARIEKGELLLSRSRDYWTAMKRYDSALNAKRKADEEVAKLEALCELLGPNGARVPALEQALGAFLAKINPFTEAFGWTVGIQVEPWQVVVNGRPVETYSESEQFRIGVAIQLAIAEMSGLSFAIVDRLDMLDLPSRRIVTQMLHAAPLEQILVLATREPEQPLPTGEGLIAYRLAKEDGRTVIAERTGA